MNKVTKFLMAAVIFFGFAACNNNDVPDNPQTGEAQAYMAVTLNMPVGGGLRSDGQNQDEPDYNYVGKWAGKDKIEKVSIYMVATDGSAVEKQENLNYTEYYNEPMKATDGSNTVVLTPKKGVKVTTLADKEVKVYVMLNASDKAITLLSSATATNFAAEFKKAIEISTQAEAVATAQVTEAVTAGGKIAKKNGTDNETIMMTCLNPSDAITLVKGTTEQEAVAVVRNQAKVSVERTVARVMVSLAAQTFEIKDKADASKVLGTIKDIRYVIGQGERRVFISKNAGTNVNNSWLTPGSGFVPTNATYQTQAVEWYDYSSLWVDYAADGGASGTIIPTIADYRKEIGTVTGELENSLTGKFLLPNTHLSSTVRETSEYKKGNTAYILVRGIFDPKPEIFADFGKNYTPATVGGTGEPVPAYQAGDDFYVGTNGKFYVSMRSVRDPQAGGVNGMEANRYVKGKVLYFAWLNPDKNNDKEWLNSPVVRNNIYHVHISGFKSIGVNWNPLVPDITNPNNPNTPGTPNPNNPDPNPNVPGSDPENPVDPEDPLSNDDTYMSVEITVLPWLVHSYKIDLGF